MIKPTNIEEFNDAIREGNVVLKFGAEWCPSCKTLDPIIESLDEDFKIVNVNVDNLPDAAGAYRVMQIPTTFIIVDSIEKTRFSGIKSANEIRELFEG